MTFLALLLLAVPTMRALAAPLTLEDAVREALTAGPAAAVVEAEARAARAEARAEAAWENPSLVLDQGVGESSVIVEVPIDPSGLSRSAAAGRARDAVAVRRDAARAAVGVAVATAYLDAIRADERARVAGDARALAARQGEAARRLLAAGEVSVADAALLEAEAAASLARALETAREATLARMRLESLLGRTPAGDVDPTGWPDLPTPPTLDPATLPAVIAADLDARAALAELAAARLDLLPDLTVGAGPALNEGDTGLAWAASIELPLFAPRTSPVVAAAGSRDRALAEADRARLDAAVALATATRSFADARFVAEAYATVDLRGALSTAAAAWEAGELSLPDWLVRRDAILDALAASIDARWELGRANLAVWELAGVLPPEFTP
ncbi:MAG: TolC family protein [Myxococcota bacterium]